MKKFLLMAIAGAISMGPTFDADATYGKKHFYKWLKKYHCPPPSHEPDDPTQTGGDTCEQSVDLVLEGTVPCVCGLEVTAIENLDVFASGYDTFSDRPVGTIMGGCNTQEITVSIVSLNGGLLGQVTNDLLEYQLNFGNSLTFDSGIGAGVAYEPAPIDGAEFAGGENITLDMTINDVPMADDYSDTVTVTIAGVI
ncbi:hypothetical protein JCM19232_1372 [Vibrio ishigakensis]|uniref:Uncharacterized protein n=1 Tax=Vibrio ishigakensis TaxID=1481914 RepID=A0A0B8P8Q9_9VIBR|nr:hypothetical protein JCM19232_1372 [Vibrio ishigakensis]